MCKKKLCKKCFLYKRGLGREGALDRRGAWDEGALAGSGAWVVHLINLACVARPPGAPEGTSRNHGHSMMFLCQNKRLISRKRQKLGDSTACS